MKRSLEEYNTVLIQQIPEEFKKEIDVENKIFTIESTNFKVDILVKNILDLYKKRSEKMSKLVQERAPYTELMNLNLFIMLNEQVTYYA